MQITFDPLVPAEVEAVKNFLSRGSRTTVVHLTGAGGGNGAGGNAGSYSIPLSTIDSTPLDSADDPSVGADPPPVGPTIAQLQADGHLPPSASPLPQVPAPSTAAATLFPTAPAAPQASVPPAPPVPSPPVPAAPPPAPAPTANAAPMPPAGDVDSTGLPWDERIHASTKTMNADGTWRQRRGLNDPGLVKRVEAELRVMQAVITHPTNPLPGQDATLDAAVATAVAGNVPPAPIAATVVVPPPPVTPVTPVAVPAPPVPAGASSVTMTAEVAAVVGSTGAPSDFGNTMNIVTKLIAAGLVKEEGVNAVLLSVGLNPNQIGVLAGDPAKTQQVADALRALVGA